METKEVRISEVKKGDKVIIIMKTEQDRMGVVSVNHKTAKTIELVGDNLISVAIPYENIERIEKFVLEGE